jgi:hypothetical protein
MMDDPRRDGLINAICARLGSPQQRTNIAGEVRQRVELYIWANSMLTARGLKNAKATSKAARELRAVICTSRPKGEKATYAELLRAAPDSVAEGIRPLELFDRWLAWLEGITGPDVRFESKKWCAADCMRGLIEQFLQEPPRANAAEGPMRVGTSYVYELMGGEPGLDLERACRVVLRKPKVRAKPKRRAKVKPKR